LYKFEFRTGKVCIDHGKCASCSSYACVKACSLYGRGILRVEAGKPILTVEPEEAKRLCIECLACELSCLFDGRAAIKLMLPFGDK